MRINAASATDVGRERTLNEDYCLVDPALGLYVVCDGMGGHAAGEIASRTAATMLQEHLRAHEEELRAIDRGDRTIDHAAVIMREGVERASRSLYDLGRSDNGKKGMGTTCIAVLARGEKAVMAHVGDSRLYLVRGQATHQLSEDHTFIQEALRHGLMTPEQAKESTHQNIVTRAVGPMERVIVDTLVFDLLPGDQLLLCSDGLHGYLEDPAEIPGLLRSGALDDVPVQLCELANERGGSDNITAVLVSVDAVDVTDRQESQRMTLVNATFDALRDVALFAELTMPELVRVQHSARVVDRKAGDTIIEEGEASETLFVLVEGHVEVVRGQTKLADLTAGSHFGEMALLSQRPRSATVRAIQSSRLLALDRVTFFHLLQQDPVLAGKFLWRLAQTLSLRLDDFYLFHEAAVGQAAKSTLRFGLYPSPFNTPKKS